jgi:hypothetical protein
MIRCLQGETLKVEVNVVDAAGDPKELTGASAQLAYRKAGEDAAEKVCAIVGSQVSVLFSAADTAAMSGQYSLEIKVKDVSSYVDAVYTETLNIEPSLQPNY